MENQVWYKYDSYNWIDMILRNVNKWRMTKNEMKQWKSKFFPVCD